MQADAHLQTSRQAVKEAEQAKAQAETAAQLVAEKEKTISTLSEKLTAAENKLAGYDTLRDAEQAARTRADDLAHQLEQIKKESETAVEIAVMRKEREMQQQIQDLQIELAKLQGRLEATG